MKKLSINHVYQRVDLPRFEETFFSETFNSAIADQVGMRERRLLEERELDDGRTLLRTRWITKVRLPRVLAKLTGSDEIRYDERSVWDPTTHTLRFEIEHPFQRRFQVQGSIRFEPADAGVRQRVEAEVTVSVPGVRGLVERFLEGELRQAYDLKHGIMQRYLDEHA